MFDMKSLSISDRFQDRLALYRVGEPHCGPPIFLCHGITHSMLPVYFTRIEGTDFATRLAEMGHTVHACDYAGYGNSGKRPGMAVNLATAVRDVKRSADYLFEGEGIERLNLLGWSWGLRWLENSLHCTLKGSTLTLYGFKWHFGGCIFPHDRSTSDRRINTRAHLESDFTCDATRISSVIDSYVENALRIDPTSPKTPAAERRPVRGVSWIQKRFQCRR